MGQFPSSLWAVPVPLVPWGRAPGPSLGTVPLVPRGRALGFWAVPLVHMGSANAPGSLGLCPWFLGAMTWFLGAVPLVLVSPAPMSIFIVL